MNLAALAEAADLTRTDRRLTDKIEAQRKRIDSDIKARGYSDLAVDGKIFRVRFAEG